MKNIDIEVVKKLRDMTNAGILDCKNSLVEAKGDIQKAIKILKAKGKAKSIKIQNRVSADGVVFAFAKGNKAVILELSCETDFVAKTPLFLTSCKKIVKEIVSTNTLIKEDLEAIKIENELLADFILGLSFKTGEKVEISNFKVLKKENNQEFSIYNHSNNKISVILLLSKKIDKEVALGLTMHVCAMNPLYIRKNDVEQSFIENAESEIKEKIVREFSDKSEVIRKNMLAGRLKKELSEIILIDQPFVKNTKLKIRDILKENNVDILSMLRYKI